MIHYKLTKWLKVYCGLNKLAMTKRKKQVITGLSQYQKSLEYTA